MADDFKIKIEADVSEVEKGFDSIKKSIDQVANKKLGIKMDEGTSKQLTEGLKSYYRELQEQNTKVQDKIKDLVKTMKDAKPDTDAFKEARRELSDMVNISGKLKGNLSEAELMLEPQKRSGSMARFGKGFKGFGRDVTGMLGKIPGLGRMIPGAAGGAGMGMAGMLGGAAAGLGAGALAAVVGESYASYQQRKQAIPTTVEIGQLMGAQKFQRMRGGMLRGGAEAGVGPMEMLQTQQQLLQQMGVGNWQRMREAQGQDPATQLQRMRRGFGIDAAQSTNFLGAMRRAGGRADMDLLKNIVTDGMKAGIDKADLPKYLQVIADATEQAALAGEINQGSMAEALQSMAEANEFFRNNPAAMGAAVGAAGQLFGATSGLGGAFSTGAMLGMRPGATLSDVLFEKQLVSEGGIFAKGFLGEKGGEGAMFGGQARIDMLRKQFKDMSQGMNEKQKGLLAKQLMPGSTMRVGYDLLTGRKYGRQITDAEKEDIKQRIREGKSLQNLKGEDFKSLMLDAQKQALRDEIGIKLFGPVNKIAEFLNTIRDGVTTIVGFLSEWLGEEPPEEKTQRSIEGLAHEKEQLEKNEQYEANNWFTKRLKSGALDMTRRRMKEKTAEAKSNLLADTRAALESGDISPEEKAGLQKNIQGVLKAAGPGKESAEILTALSEQLNKGSKGDKENVELLKLIKGALDLIANRVEKDPKAVVPKKILNPNEMES